MPENDQREGNAKQKPTEIPSTQASDTSKPKATKDTVTKKAAVTGAKKKSSTIKTSAKKKTRAPTKKKAMPKKQAAPKKSMTSKRTATGSSAADSAATSPASAPPLTTTRIPSAAHTTPSQSKETTAAAGERFGIVPWIILLALIGVGTYMLERPTQEEKSTALADELETVEKTVVSVDESLATVEQTSPSGKQTVPSAEEATTETEKTMPPSEATVVAIEEKSTSVEFTAPESESHSKPSTATQFPSSSPTQTRVESSGSTQEQARETAEIAPDPGQNQSLRGDEGQASIESVPYPEIDERSPPAQPTHVERTTTEVTTQDADTVATPPTSSATQMTATTEHAAHGTGGQESAGVKTPVVTPRPYGFNHRYGWWGPPAVPYRPIVPYGYPRRYTYGGYYRSPRTAPVE